MRYDARCSRCGQVEITKPMLAKFPDRHECGGELTRLYGVPAVHYNAPGFYSSDVACLKGQIGPERFARFERRKADIEKRAAAGKLTAYERAVENIV